MQDAMVLLIVALIAVGWIAICIAVGRAAKAKSRSQGLWGFMSFAPLGPIMAPLFLSSLPVVGEKPSKRQLVGRTVLILWLLVSLVIRAAGPIITESEKQTVAKAEAEYGIETEYVTTHYRKMSVDEIVDCVSMSQTWEAMQHDANYDEADETYYFESQAQADTYNGLLARYEEMECEERTYDIADLGRAMKIIQGDS